MKRWEKRLKKIEKTLDWIEDRREYNRTKPWLKYLDPPDDVVEAPALVSVPKAAPPPARPPPPAASPPPPPPPPPQPLVEFINERAGMSIAINTRTGQMASSADVMEELSRRAREKAQEIEREGVIPSAARDL